MTRRCSARQTLLMFKDHFIARMTSVNKNIDQTRRPIDRFGWILMFACIFTVFSRQVDGQTLSNEVNVTATADLLLDVTSPHKLRAGPPIPANLSMQDLGHFYECLMHFTLGWYKAIPGLQMQDKYCVCMKSDDDCRPGVNYLKHPDPKYEMYRQGKEMTENPSAIKKNMKIMGYCLAIPSLILGTAGNVLLLITIFTFPGTITPVNVFISNLAVVDFLASAFCAPMEIMKIIGLPWRLGMIFCKFTWYMYFVFFVESVLTMAVMSCERYIAIVLPMKARKISTVRRACLILLATWAITLIVAFPVALITNNHVHVYSFGIILCVAPTARHKTYGEWNGVVLLGINIVLFLVPVVIMAVMYSLTARKLIRSILSQSKLLGCGSDSDRKKSAQAIEGERSRMQVVYMLMTSVLVFFLCWGPGAVSVFIDYFGDGVLGRTHIYVNYARPISSILPIFNSCLNPFLYGVFSRKFREGYLLVLCCRQRKMVRRAALPSAKRTQSLRTPPMSISASEAPSTDKKEDVRP